MIRALIIMFFFCTIMFYSFCDFDFCLFYLASYFCIIFCGKQIARYMKIFHCLILFDFRSSNIIRLCFGMHMFIILYCTKYQWARRMFFAQDDIFQFNYITWKIKIPLTWKLATIATLVAWCSIKVGLGLSMTTKKD